MKKIKKAHRRYLRWVKQFERPRYRPGSIHFLHVGKAAGSQVARIIQQIERSDFARPIVKHKHRVALRHLPEDHDYFFCTRDPITRFRSGFYSRKRKAQPRYFIDWTQHEEKSFGRFEHANDLAEALSADGPDRLAAIGAMRSIKHNSDNLVDWFKYTGNLFDLRPPVWIIRQERFDADLQILLSKIGYEGDVEVTSDEKLSHANDYEGIPPLSETAKENLRKWYAQDYAFIDICEAWLAENAPNDA